MARYLVLLVAAISRGIASLNFDAVALSRDDRIPKSDEGKRCRKEVCAEFVSCVDTDRRGQLKTEKDQCTDAHEERLKKCEEKKDPQDPLWTEFYKCQRESVRLWRECGDAAEGRHRQRVRNTCCGWHDPCKCPGVGPNYPACGQYGSYCAHSH